VLGNHFTHNDLICVQNENEQQRKNAINPNEFNNLDQRDFLHNHPKQDDVKEIIEFHMFLRLPLYKVHCTFNTY
jgi:hypothetical protein